MPDNYFTLDYAIEKHGDDEYYAFKDLNWPSGSTPKEWFDEANALVCAKAGISQDSFASFVLVTLLKAAWRAGMAETFNQEDAETPPESKLAAEGRELITNVPTSTEGERGAVEMMMIAWAVTAPVLEAFLREQSVRSAILHDTRLDPAAKMVREQMLPTAQLFANMRDHIARQLPDL